MAPGPLSSTLDDEEDDVDFTDLVDFTDFTDRGLLAGLRVVLAVVALGAVVGPLGAVVALEEMVEVGASAPWRLTRCAHDVALVIGSPPAVIVSSVVEEE